MRTAANDNFQGGSSIRFSVEPRLVPPVKAARRLHLTLKEFTEKREALFRAGMPRPCTVTGHYDLLAIEQWLDRRAGLGGMPMPVAAAAQLVSDRLATLG